MRRILWFILILGAGLYLYAKYVDPSLFERVRSVSPSGRPARSMPDVPH
jgi:hypothetical protein